MRSPGLCKIFTLFLSAIAVLWLLFILYELRETFSDPDTKHAARKKLIEDLRNFSKTGQDIFEHITSTFHLLTANYKLQFQGITDGIGVFLREITGQTGSYISEYFNSSSAAPETETSS